MYDLIPLAPRPSTDPTKPKSAKQPQTATPTPSNPKVFVEVNSIQSIQTSGNNKKKGKNKNKNKKPGNQQKNPKSTNNDNDKGKRKEKYPCLLCRGDHFTKECPRQDEITQFLKTNPTPAVLMDPFPSQQQLIDHMSNQGNSSSSKEIRMMSLDTISLQTQSQNYDKPTDKKEDHSSSRKAPSISSPDSLSNVPLTIEKPTLDMVLHPPKSTLRKAMFNPDA